MSLIKLLTSRSHTGALLSVVMHEMKLTLPLWAWSTFFMLTDRMFLVLTQYKWIYQDHTEETVPEETSQFLISLFWMILLIAVGWREAAGCLLHLPGDVWQVLLYTAAPQWSGSLLHGSGQVGGGGGGTSGGTRQGEVTMYSFSLNYSNCYAASSLTLLKWFEMPDQVNIELTTILRRIYIQVSRVVFYLMLNVWLRNLLSISLIYALNYMELVFLLFCMSLYMECQRVFWLT